MKSALSPFALTLVSLLLASCAQFSSSPPPAAQVSEKALDFSYPKLTPREPGGEILEKSGVRIVASAVMPERVKDSFVTSMSEVPQIVVMNNVRTYNVVTQEIEYFTSEYLSFSAACTNKTSSAMRLSGAAVVVQVDGQLANLSQDSFKELQKVIVPPGGNFTFTVPGPKWEVLQDGSTVKLGLYDVQIGSETANFEFEYVTALDPQQIVVRQTTERQQLNPQQSAAMSQKIAKDQKRVVSLMKMITAKGSVEIN